jgi:hypothetical protein
MDRQHSALTALMATLLFPLLLIASGEKGKETAQPNITTKLPANFEQWDKSTWRISFELDMPDLEPQAVQYTVLSKDPAPKYAAQVKKMRGFHRQQLDAAEGELAKAQIRDVQMMVDWDSGFKDVTGDNLWLLTRGPGKQSASNILSSNSPAGKKWVVTKTVFVKQKPVCWCVPVELKMGKQVVVKLDKNNTFDLQPAYLDGMK